ncbi:MAG TPA: class I SAM-dependent methyltransferase [Candidatus Limnocylindrales bacterium]|nr:class I SAM-dependent methyltransferase [Candidatus Limnocylindrales bacterium]
MSKGEPGATGPDPAGPIVVRDDPDHPDQGFADLYAALPPPVDLEPWLSLGLKARPPVLYLGIGAGRLAIPLWQAGIRLVGVDAHPGMLKRLTAVLPDIQVHRSRVEDLDLQARFDLVIVPSNILCTTDRLRRAAAHLKPGGRLAFELMNPHWLRVTTHQDVRVLDFTAERAQIEVDYHPPSGPRYTQVASVPLVWPERIEEWLDTAGLQLHRMRPSVEGPLEESPTFYVEAVSAGLSR